MNPDSAVEEESSVLQQFRKEWQNEVNARSKQGVQKNSNATQVKPQRRGSHSKPERPVNRPPIRHPLADVRDEDDGYDETESPRSGLIEKIEGLRVRETDEDDFSITGSNVEPKSALEHYERAVEKESQGNLGDSLSHYRRAYRLDAKVDQSYRNKHFPGKWKGKSSAANPSDAAPTGSDLTPATEETHVPLTFEEMIASFANLSIPNAKPIIEGDQEPPCPIRRLPAEVLIDLLQHVAIRDPSAFARLALVCKQLAYHVFKDNQIWRRVALGPEFGLASQQYNFVTDVQGREAIFRTLEDDEGSETTYPPVDEDSFPKDTDFREVFHSHPRIRFSGVYISTVNYTRDGAPSQTPGTWQSSVHIVTYYRYLRFYRDGTVISLLTTSEPTEVVHHLTRENLAMVRPLGKNIPPGQAAGTVSKDGQTVSVAVQSFIKHALRGRWRLCHPSVGETATGLGIGSNLGTSGDLHIETEGAAPRYTYTMHLGLRSGSRSKQVARNNKLAWKGFWKYNTLTDDWSDFHLRHDKSFFFARVKSYGLGY